jgi:GxxExxY protein
MTFWQFREKDVRKVDDETERLATEVIGAAIEVHTILGPSLPEVAYRKALARELMLRGIACTCEHVVPIIYKGELVAEGRADILVCGRLVIELKVVEALNDVHRAQVLAYLAALKLELGLLINFNVSYLKDGIKRVIRTSEVRSSSRTSFAP